MTEPGLLFSDLSELRTFIVEPLSAPAGPPGAKSRTPGGEGKFPVRIGLGRSSPGHGYLPHRRSAARSRRSARPAGPHRLAGVGRRVPRRDRAALPGLSPGRAVAAGLRVLRADPRAWLERHPDRAGLGGADATAGL